MIQKKNIDLLCIGFLCHDLKDEKYILGGTVSYSSLMAHHLGKNTGILTSVGNDFQYSGLFNKNNITLIIKPAKKTTVFENIYKNKIRTQYIYDRSETIYNTDIPNHLKNTPIVLFGPIADEVDFSLLNNFPNSLKAATIQGWLRQWDKNGKIAPKEMDWPQLKNVDIVILSNADIAGFDNALENIIRYANIVVLTKGAEGAVVFYKNKTMEFPAFPVNEIDPTGAGDIFAASFLVKYAETKDIALSAGFANAAASFVVEKIGVYIPDKKEIKKRFQQKKIN